MNKLKCPIIFTITLSFLLLACSKKTIEPIQIETQQVPEIINTKHNYITLLDSISKQEWLWYYSKLDVNYNDQAKSFSFKSSVKSTKDSSTNILITFSRIPIFNTLITPDSIMVVNKKDRCFQTQSIAYFIELLGMEISLANLQEILLGLPLNFDEDLTYNIIENDSLAIINCVQQASQSNGANGKEIIYSYYLNPITRCFFKETIESKTDLTNFEVRYSEFQKTSGINLPKYVSLTVTSPNKNIFIEITYEKTELNIPQDINLTIPENYEKCN